MVWNYQDADCSLRIIVSFIIIFGRLSSPMPSRRHENSNSPTAQVADSEVNVPCKRQLAEWVIWHRLPQFRIRRFDVAVGDCTSLTRTRSVGEELTRRRDEFLCTQPLSLQSEFTCRRLDLLPTCIGLHSVQGVLREAWYVSHAHCALQAQKSLKTHFWQGYRSQSVRLTIESYTVVMLLTFIRIITSISSPVTLSLQAFKPSFCTNPFHLLFLAPCWLHGFPGLFTGTSECIRFFCFLVFLFSTF